jgi:hypothetical protein
MKLSPLQLRGLNKLGDALVPGDGEFPSFSRSGCAAAVDRVLDHMGAADLADLRGLLTVMAILPTFLVRAFAAFLELSLRWNGPLGGLLRFARLGVRGLVFTLYYSDPGTLKSIGYEVKVHLEKIR